MFSKSTMKKAKRSKSLVDFEQKKWDKYFFDTLNMRGQEHVGNAWSSIADQDALAIIAKNVASNNEIYSVLEAGCGSGEMSRLLLNQFKVQHLTLADISKNALLVAKKNFSKQLKRKISYIEADITKMPLPDDSVDLCWNVGVIEHYPLQFLLDIVGEMLRVTKPGGHVICAIPNRWSLSTLKAWGLGTKIGRRLFAWVPGYRFDSEILYGNSFLRATLEENFEVPVKLEFGGSPLWFNAPKCVAFAARKMTGSNRFLFLTFFILRKEVEKAHHI